MQRGNAILLVAASSMALLPASVWGGLAIEVGEPFPVVTMPSLDGTARSIADFRGQKTMLHIFASW